LNNEIQAQRAFGTAKLILFQRIYTHKKSKFSNTLDQIFRKDMYERFQFTIANCEPIKGGRFSTSVAATRFTTSSCARARERLWDSTSPK
jgi:hypothetical protein